MTDKSTDKEIPGSTTPTVAIGELNLVRLISKMDFDLKDPSQLGSFIFLIKVSGRYIGRSLQDKYGARMAERPPALSAYKNVAHALTHGYKQEAIPSLKALADSNFAESIYHALCNNTFTGLEEIQKKFKAITPYCVTNLSNQSTLETTPYFQENYYPLINICLNPIDPEALHNELQSIISQDAREPADPAVYQALHAQNCYEVLAMLMTAEAPDDMQKIFIHNDEISSYCSEIHRNRGALMHNDIVLDHQFFIRLQANIAYMDENIFKHVTLPIQYSKNTLLALHEQISDRTPIETLLQQAADIMSTANNIYAKADENAQAMYQTALSGFHQGWAPPPSPPDTDTMYAHLLNEQAQAHDPNATRLQNIPSHSHNSAGIASHLITEDTTLDEQIKLLDAVIEMIAFQESQKDSVNDLFEGKISQQQTEIVQLTTSLIESQEREIQQTTTLLNKRKDQFESLADEIDTKQEEEQQIIKLLDKARGKRERLITYEKLLIKRGLKPPQTLKASLGRKRETADQLLIKWKETARELEELNESSDELENHLEQLNTQLHTKEKELQQTQAQLAQIKPARARAELEQTTPEPTRPNRPASKRPKEPPPRRGSTAPPTRASTASEGPQGAPLTHQYNTEKQKTAKTTKTAKTANTSKAPDAADKPPSPRNG